MKTKGKIIVVFSFVVFLTLLAISVWGDFSSHVKAPIYQVITLEDPETQLYEDAFMLGLDLSNAELEEDHLGWWIISNNDFEVRRLKGSGYFTYISKKTTWPNYVKGKEPVNEDYLKLQAMELLEAVGVPLNQVRNATISRIVDQSEDEYGNDVGPRETVAFIVYVDRQLSGTLVMDSDAKVVFNAEGQLNKITTSWRQVEATPIGYANVIDEETLLDAAEELTSSLSHGQQLTIFKTQYAFREAPHKQDQKQFELQYVVIFSYGSFVEVRSFRAIE